MEVLVTNQQDKIEVGERWRRLAEEAVLAAVETAREWRVARGVAVDPVVEQVLADPSAEASVAFLDNESIHRLNREFRGVDRPTDVLSFPMDDEPEAGEALLGDIAVSLETAIAQAAEYGHSQEREIGFLVVHGALHLLGFDHENDADRAVMRELEEATMVRLALPR